MPRVSLLSVLALACVLTLGIFTSIIWRRLTTLEQAPAMPLPPSNAWSFGGGSSFIGDATNATSRALFGGDFTIDGTCLADIDVYANGTIANYTCDTTPVRVASNASCVASFVELANGLLVALPGCTPPQLPSLGLPDGFACPSVGDVIQNFNLVNGRVSDAVCGPIAATNLSALAVGGALTGMLPNPQLAVTFPSPGCFDMGLSTMCVNNTGLVSSVTGNGVSFVQVGSALSSTTLVGTYGGTINIDTTGVVAGSYPTTSNRGVSFTVNTRGQLTVAADGPVFVVASNAFPSSTLAGTYATTIDLIPTGVAAGTYGSGNRLVTSQVDTYGRIVTMANGNAVVVNGTALASSTLGGVYGGVIDLLSSGVAPGTYGGSNLLTLTLDTYGRATFAADGSVPVIVGASITSSTLTGTYGGVIDLATTGVVPGTYGQNSSCFPTLTVDVYGRLSSVSCFSIAGLGGGSGSDYSIFLGTPDQVIVTVISNTTLQFATPQSIGLTSSPTFAGLTLSGQTANTIAVFGASKQLQSAPALTNGNFLIGVTGSLPVAGTITAGTGTTVALGSGTITVGVASTQTFASLNLTGQTANTPLVLDASNRVVSLVLTNGNFVYGGTSGVPVAGSLLGTTNQVIVSIGATALTLSLPQSIHTAADVVFNSVQLNGLSNTNSLVYATSGRLLATLPMTDGQLLFGVTGGIPVASTLTAGVGIVVTPFSGGTTIAIASTQTLSALNLTGQTANTPLVLDANNRVVSLVLANGNFVYGGTSGVPVAGSILGTANQVIVSIGASALTLSLPQSIATTSSPTFASLSLTSFVGGFLLKSTGAAITETSITTASLITTSTSAGGDLAGTYPNPTLATLGTVAPGVYGGNTSCIPQVTINAKGQTTNVACFSIAGIFAPSSINSTFVGTPNQIIINQVSSSALQFSTPQDIGTGSNVVFNGLTLGGVTASTLAAFDGSKNAVSFSLPSGNLIIGTASGLPAAALPTSTTLTITPGSGTLTFELLQPLDTTNGPTFANVTLSNLTPNRILVSGTSGLVTTAAAGLNGQLFVAGTGVAPAWATVGSTTLTITGGSNTLAINAPQAIDTGASPTFVGATLSGLAANRLLVTGVGGAISATAAATNGQIPIGSTGAAPVWNTITGTLNQVTVSNGAGTVTLSLPQSIAAASSPTFTGLTLSGLTTNRVMLTTTSGGITTFAAMTNGQLIIGSTGVAPALATLTGSADVTITNGAGTITVSLVQSIATGASPSFTGLTISGLSANRVMLTTTGGAVTTFAAMTNGQLIIGSTGVAPVVASLTGTSLQITVTAGAGSITLSLPQNIDTAANVVFGSARLSALCGSGYTSYTTGTASQSGTTVTGSGTTFTALMQSGIIVWTGSAAQAYIVVVTDGTHLTVDNSATVSSGAFVICYGGVQSATGDLTVTGRSWLGTAYNTTGVTLKGMGRHVIVGPQNSGSETTTPIMEYHFSDLAGRPFLLTGALYQGLSFVQGNSYYDNTGTLRASIGGKGGAGIDFANNFAHHWVFGAEVNLDSPVGTKQIVLDIGVYNSGTVFRAALPQETANTVVLLDGNKAMYGAALTNGQFIIGSTGAAPAAGSIGVAANSLTMTAGANTITLGLATYMQTQQLSLTTSSLSTGTVSTGGVSSTTVTCSSASFTAAMAGGILKTASTVSVVTAVLSTTQVKVDPAVTITAGTSYTLAYGGASLGNAGGTGIYNSIAQTLLLGPRSVVTDLIRPSTGLMIFGPSSGATGLSIQTSDVAYPVIQLFAYTAATTTLNAFLAAGASWDSVNAKWVSTATSVPGRLNFKDGAVNTEIASNGGANTDVTSWSTVLSVLSTGIKINGGSTLTTISSGSFSTTFAGACTTGSVTVQYSRTHDTVTIRVPPASCTSTVGAVLASASALPAGFRPAAFICIQIGVFNGGSGAVAGSMGIQTGGGIVISPGITCAGAFLSSGTVGFDASTTGSLTASFLVN